MANDGIIALTWIRIRLLKESPVGMVGAFLVLFWVLVALFAPWLSPFDPNANNLDALIDPTPSAVNWLGTDNSGRDILSRIIWGSRTVFTVAEDRYSDHFSGRSSGRDPKMTGLENWPYG